MRTLGRVAVALVVGVWIGRAQDVGAVILLVVCASVVACVYEWCRRCRERDTLASQAAHLARQRGQP